MQKTTVTVIGRDRIMARVARVKTAAQAARSSLAHETGDLLKGALQAEAPGNGPLRDSVRYRTSTSQSKVTVRFSAAWFTRFVTKGTKPHDIWAGFYSGKSDKRFLFFEGEGVTHVHHPGARANDFVGRAYDASRAGIAALVKAAGRVILGA